MGDFVKMRTEFAVLSRRGVTASTPAFSTAMRSSQAPFLTPSKLPRSTEDVIAMTLRFAPHGWTEDAIDALKDVTDFGALPPAALFWRGVYEEEKGNRDAALEFYTRAMDADDALAKYAV